jgi:tetratricopeptide (TPR) repeat protein
LISSFYLGEFSLPRAVMTGMLRSVVMFVGYNLFFGAVIARTDNAAHVGGLLMGLFLGALIAKVAPGQDEFLLRISVLLVGILFVGAGVMWLRHSRGYLAHAQYGVLLFQDGKMDEGISELQKSASLRPDFAPAHAALAQAYRKKRDFENAAAELKRLIALNPRDEDAYYRLGRIYLELKLPSKAEGTFAQLLRIDPESPDGHVGLGDTFADQHRNLDALAEYKRVAALDSGYQSVYYNIGVMQDRLKLYDDAIASLLKQRQAGDDPQNENLLADVYQTKGMKSEAEAAREKAKQFQTPR